MIPVRAHIALPARNKLVELELPKPNRDNLLHSVVDASRLDATADQCQPVNLALLLFNCGPSLCLRSDRERLIDWSVLGVEDVGGEGVAVLHIVLEEGGDGLHCDVVIAVDLHLGVEPVEVEHFANSEDDLLDAGVDGADEGEGLLAGGHVDFDLDVPVLDLFHWNVNNFY